MRPANNRTGYSVEILTPIYGWRPVGFGKPHESRELAGAAMAELKAAAPGREFRIYPSIEVKA